MGEVPNMKNSLPAGDPGWDTNTGGGLKELKDYQNFILHGIQHGIQKSPNGAK